MIHNTIQIQDLYREERIEPFRSQDLWSWYHTNPCYYLSLIQFLTENTFRQKARIRAYSVGGSQFVLISTLAKSKPQRWRKSQQFQKACLDWEILILSQCHLSVSKVSIKIKIYQDLPRAWSPLKVSKFWDIWWISKPGGLHLSPSCLDWKCWSQHCQRVSLDSRENLDIFK